MMTDLAKREPMAVDVVTGALTPVREVYAQLPGKRFWDGFLAGHVPLESGFASRIQPILDACVRGPYRVVHHALLPYVRIMPVEREQLVVVHAHERLRLRGGATDVALLNDGELTLVICFEADDRVTLADIDFYPDKRDLANRALASVRRAEQRALAQAQALPPARTLAGVRAELIATLQATVAWMERMIEAQA